MTSRSSERFWSSSRRQRALALAILLIALTAAAARSQTAGSAGAFARMGFSARGMGMGNALTAVTSGDISTYYNPALAAFSEQRTAAASVGLLSLDRSLNFLSYTQAIKPTAGISFGLINAGVGSIDGRDADGFHTEDYSTFENQFFLAFSNRVDPRVSIGIGVKLYYSKLFDQVKSTTVGFDGGICIRATDELTIGGVIQDINSKYKWDSKSLYDVNGKTTEDKFPTLQRIGLAYLVPGTGGLISGEFEHSSEGTNVIRVGAEYTLTENFAARGGVDRWDFSSDATGIKPTFGFTVKNSFNGWSPAISYAYIIESFAPAGMHIITVSAAF